MFRLRPNDFETLVFSYYFLSLGFRSIHWFLNGFLFDTQPGGDYEGVDWRMKDELEYKGEHERHDHNFFRTS